MLLRLTTRSANSSSLSWSVLVVCFVFHSSISFPCRKSEIIHFLFNSFLFYIKKESNWLKTITHRVQTILVNPFWVRIKRCSEHLFILRLLQGTCAGSARDIQPSFLCKKKKKTQLYLLPRIQNYSPAKWTAQTANKYSIFSSWVVQAHG